MKKTLSILPLLVMLSLSYSQFANAESTTNVEYVRNAKQVQKDDYSTMDLTRELNNKYPSNYLNIAVFDNTLVLTGQVLDEVTRKDIIRDAEDETDIPDARTFSFLTTVSSDQKMEDAQQIGEDTTINEKIKAQLQNINGIDPSLFKTLVTDKRIYILANISHYQEALINNQLQLGTESQADLGDAKSIIKIINYTDN